ncbi:MAG: hypothetical protein J5642_00080 [Bacteroidales bacterium]|nr:hypothetical protein [Bacteroidales bacterium]
MKKILLMSLLLLLGTAAIAQSQHIMLKFVGQSTDSIRIQMDYVEVNNLSSDSTIWGDSLIVAWPDTVLEMTLDTIPTSIHDYAAVDGFSLVHAGPNPFNGKTEVALQLAASGNVVMQVFDMSGKRISVYNGTLSAGVHRFQVRVTQTQSYLLTAQCGAKRTSIKLVNAGYGQGNGISYIGSHEEPLFLPKVQLENAFRFGDTLTFTGFATFNDSLYASETVVLLMDSLQDTLQNIVLTFPVSLPSVVTWLPDTITDHSAFVGGTVISDGGILLNEKGIVWGDHSGVTMEDRVIAFNDTMVGDFDTLLSALQPNIPCFVRAYAANELGIAYGREYAIVPLSQLRDNMPCVVETVTDANGITYNTVRIGRQCWTRENLRTTRYNDTTEVFHAPLDPVIVLHIDSLFRDTVITVTYDTTIVIDTIIIPYDTIYRYEYHYSDIDSAITQIDTIISIVQHSDTLKLIDHITTTYISTHNGYIPQYDTTFYYVVVWPADTLDHIVINTIVDTSYLFSGIETTPIDTIHYPIYSDTIAYYYYPCDTVALEEVYGLLYNYRAASGESERSIAEPSGIRGICPEGWHIPSIGEWEQLTGYLEGQHAYHAGGITTNISKALASTDNWQRDTTYTYSVGNAPENNNATGFTALPAGAYSDSTGAYTRFWSCSGEQPTDINVIRLSYDLPIVASGVLAPDSVASVRCVRDVAEAADGFACPGMPTVTDADGNVYNTVMVGNQCWMKENLRTTRYPDNTILTEGTELSDSIAYYYLPSMEESELALYGVLYNWTAATTGGAQGICPIGWHVPTADEWMQLHRYVASINEYHCGNGSNSIGKALASEYGWRPSASVCNVGDTTTVHDATGFSALPTGRYPDNSIGISAYFWTSTDVSNANATVRYLNYSTPNFSEGSMRKEYAASVRCIKD